MGTILFVCTANICRSPVGEVILQERLQKAGFTDWQVYSAGTWALGPRGASRYSVEVVREREGLDLSQHLSKPISSEIMERANLILCMASGHVEALKIEFPQHADKIFLLSEMVGMRFDIADPYGGARSDYEPMVTEVTRIIDDGFGRIISLAEINKKRE